MSEQPFTAADVDPLVALADDLRADATRLALATRAAGRRWRLMHYWLGGPAAATSAIAGASAIQSNATIAAVFAVASAVLASLTTWLNPGGTAESFLQTSRQYATLSARIDTLLRLEIETADGQRRREIAQARLVEHLEELHRVRDGSPEVPKWALHPRRKHRLRLKRMVVGSPDPKLLEQLRD